MKKIYLGLALLILILQARLLSSEGGIGELFSLQEQLAKLEYTLESQRLENALLAQKVAHLQSDISSIETIARQTLGMVKKDEVFIKVIALQSEPVVNSPSEQGVELTKK
ncbi:MAG: septum formation initiator family protein [Gammaproteobacteria bacterium]|nr:septum formation initiator family protein [Gammaproteobacteria bacterium]